jgi:hypothetical protein
VCCPRPSDVCITVDGEKVCGPPPRPRSV